MISPFFVFLIILILILILSKYELSLILSFSALLFALLAQVDILTSIFKVLTDGSIIILIIAVALIPILGGIMERSGLMLELVEKMHLSKKASLMVSPAFFGLLPVAGGALMSAPIVEQIDSKMEANKKVAINVWYRHLLIFIYPLSSALIVASVLSNISLYMLVGVLIIPFLVLFVIGYVLLLRNIEEPENTSERDLKIVFHHLIPIIIAPIIDFIGRTFFNVPFPEIFLLIGLCFSILIALKFAHMPPKEILTISKKMKLWRFPLLIFAMFWFLEVFIQSGVPEIISSWNLPLILIILIGFLLGFATGRIQIPLSILIPIYLLQYGLTTMLILDFIFLYSAIFLGYLITPVHPCLAYSIQYFKTDYKKVFVYLAQPTFVCLTILLIFTALFSL